MKKFFIAAALAALLGAGCSATAPTDSGKQQAEEPLAPTCVITVDGLKYDVQPLRSKHPGGDIFKCETDMSDLFHKQHGDSVKRIEPYLMK